MEHPMKQSCSFLGATAIIACLIAYFVIAGPAAAQIIPSKESLSGLYPGKAYSPYAQRSFPGQVFWGDTQLHTRLSADAGLFGNTLGLEEALSFPKIVSGYISDVMRSGRLAFRMKTQ
jgi:hypothetical protein